MKRNRILLICGSDLDGREFVAMLARQLDCDVQQYDRLADLPHELSRDSVAALVVVESQGDSSATADLSSLSESLAWLSTIVLTISKQPGDTRIAMRSGTAAQVLDVSCDATRVGNALATLLERQDRRPSGRITRYDLAAAKRGLESLSERHHFVLERVLSGSLNKKIARELGVSIRTVETYRSHIHKTVRVDSLAELVRICVATGYLDTMIL